MLTWSKPSNNTWSKLARNNVVQPEFTKIFLLLETYRRHIGDPSETDMPDQRPFGDPSETDMSHWRPPCLIGDQHVWSETHWRPTCLIGNRPCIRHVNLRWVSNQASWVSGEACWSLMDLQWGVSVFAEACRSPRRHIGLWWGMSVSVGLRWVFDGSPIGLQ